MTAKRTVVGQYLNADGSPAKGYIEFTPSSTLASGYIIPVSPVMAVLDDTGSFTCELIVTDDPLMIPTGWKWSVEEKIPNGQQWYLSVPTSGSPLDIATAYVVGGSGGPYYGIQGATGIQGIQGIPGPQGIPGEITLSAGDARYALKAGDTFTGDVSVNGANFLVKALTAAGEVAFQHKDENNVVRSNIKLTGTSRDISWNIYDGSGVLVGTALQIAVGTGLITVKGDPTAALGIATKQYADTKSRTFVQSSAPGSPASGDLWVDTSTPAFIAPTFVNNWSDYGGYAATGYFKDSDGFVHLRGTVKNTNTTITNSVIFNLPAGYRPTGSHIFACLCTAGMARVDVNTNGDVVLGSDNYTRPAGANVSYLSLDIKFATF